MTSVDKSTAFDAIKVPPFSVISAPKSITPAAFSVKLSVSPTALIFASISILLLAVSVNVWLRVSPEFIVISPVTVMLPAPESVTPPALLAVSITTLFPACRAFCIVVTLMTDSFAPPLSALSVKSNPSPPSTASTISSVLPELMVMFCGSSNQLPPLPLLAEASAEPATSSRPFEEVSINPPSPEFSPPLAVISPENFVYSSDQTMTFPPRPSSLASALMVTSELMIVIDAFCSGP